MNLIKLILKTFLFWKYHWIEINTKNGDTFIGAVTHRTYKDYRTAFMSKEDTQKVFARGVQEGWTQGADVCLQSRKRERKEMMDLFRGILSISFSIGRTLSSGEYKKGYNQRNKELNNALNGQLKNLERKLNDEFLPKHA